jgi:hypothetical protein
LLATGICTGSGCTGPLVKQARFRKHPQTVARGNMLGPFEGQVVDSDTSKPIENALVWCSWTFSRGIGGSAPVAARTIVTKTNPDGRYRVPRLRDLPLGLSTRLARLTFIVYREGYVSYRHDRVFGGNRRRLDFTQYANLVRLSRWSPELSHAQHLLFTGGGTAVRKASEAEVLAAVAELDAKAGIVDKSPAAKKRPTSVARLLLVGDDVRAVTGFRGPFVEQPLDQAGDASASWHLRAKEQSQRYDVALRVWRLRGAALDARFEKLKLALPSSRKIEGIGDKAFVVSQGHILGLGFTQKGKNALLLLTCGKGQCSSEKSLLDLAKRVAKRTAQLPSLPKADEQ